VYSLLSIFSFSVFIVVVLFILSRGKSQERYTYSQIRETKKKHDTFLASSLYWRFSSGLTYLLAKTNVTANQVTIMDVLFATLAAIVFWAEDYPWIIVGGLLAVFVFILDMVDGGIARLKNEASTFGLWVDHIFGAVCWTIMYLGVIGHILQLERSLFSVFYITFFLFGFFMNYVVFAETSSLLGGYPKQVVKEGLTKIARFLRTDPNNLSLTGDIQATLILLFCTLNQIKILIIGLAVIFNIQWVSAFLLLYNQRKGAKRSNSKGAVED